MRHRGPISEALTNSFLSKQQRSKNKGIIGFAPARIIEHFSFLNPKHALITIGIIVAVVCSTSFIHWLLNDFEKMEATQQREVQQIENLFEEEYKWMQKNHEATLKVLRESHQKDLDNEMKWFIEEINSITYVISYTILCS